MVRRTASRSPALLVEILTRWLLGLATDQGFRGYARGVRSNWLGLAHRGELDPRKVCVGCSGCSELMKTGMASGCVVRDGDVYQLPRRGPGKGGGG